MRIGIAVFLTVSFCAQIGQAQGTGNIIGNGESIFTRIAPNDCQAPTDAQLNDVKAAATDFRRRGDLRDEARAQILLASLYENAGEFKLAIPSLQRALVLVRPAKDGASEAQVLTMMADALTQASQGDAASADAAEALKIANRVGNLPAEASALRAHAEAIYANSLNNAMQDLERALELSRQANDFKVQALVLNDKGALAQDSSDPFDTFNRALALEGQIHDCRDEIGTLTNLATLEHDRGQIRNALDHYDQAVALEKQVGDRSTEAMTLHQLGYFHWEIGDLGQALSFFNQALQLKRQVGDTSSEGPTLAALAGVYRDTQWPATALRAYQQALPLLQQAKNNQWQIMVLNNLGTVEADLHHPAEARNYYNRAVQLASRSGDPVTPAYSAWGVGELEQSDAFASYFHAVQLAREFEQPNLEGEVDSSLMDHFRAHHQPNAAIFFGKRAVDEFQLLRRNMNGIGNDLTSSFLQRKSRAYRMLAEILIDQGRLIEAQQVLDLLKIQQYSDYVGAQPNELALPLPRSARELPLQATFDELFARYVEADKGLRALKSADHPPTPKVLQAQAGLYSAKTRFDAFLQDLCQQLDAKDGPPEAVEKVTGAELSLEKLVNSDPHMAALYTLEGTNRYSVIVITHNGRIARSYSISQEQLDRKCEMFLEALKEPSADASSPAQELYGILFAPVESDLDAIKATTLVWSLDGSLRYIPIGALKKADRYVVEDYSVVNFTPLDHLLDDVPRFEGATAIGMGTSRISIDGLEMLTHVPSELDSVVADPAVADSHGVLPGKILLNGQFTVKAMQETLQSQAVIHIASHFILKPGNDDLSFLLLGGKDKDSSGYRYSMAEFEKSNNIHIEGTKLLTLSACETGASNKRNVCFESNRSSVQSAECEAGESNQRENGVVMESISEVALEKGAEAVISSLWSVDDMSTSQLMADFYQRWIGSKDAVSKAEALREAELDLLNGNDISPPDASNRGVKIVGRKPNKPGVSAEYASPFYWAPFVLTGNWQ